MTLIMYNSFKIESKVDYIRLFADSFLEYEDIDDESKGGYFLCTTPKCWDSDFLKRINISFYNIYFICTNTVSFGNYNSVTDYKKVWGLLGITSGVYHNSYLNERGKVYFGIKRVNGEEGFLSISYPVVILVPKEETVFLEKIFEIFEIHKFDFCSSYSNGYNSIFSEVQRFISSSIVLVYGDGLNIYGKDIEEFFAESDIKKWEDSAPITEVRQWFPDRGR